MTSFTERYHELTKYNPQTIDKLDSVHWDHQPSPFKTYDQLPITDKIPLKGFLNFSQENKNNPVLKANTKQEINLENLAHLLYFSMGITARMETPAGDFYLRANPSAGGLYPTEAYVAVRDCAGLPDGLYAFHPLYAELYPIRIGNLWERISNVFLSHPSLETSNTLLILSGMYSRSAWRYKERAYRRILLDTGHLLSNVSELTNYWGLSATPIGGFVDEELEDLLHFQTHAPSYQNLPQNPKSPDENSSEGDFRDEVPLLAIALDSHPSDKSALRPQIGQRPSLQPQEAIQYIHSTEPFQLQQNSCERLYRQAMDAFRAPVPLLENANAELKNSNDLYQNSDTSWSIPNILLYRRSCRQYEAGTMQAPVFRKILDYAFYNYSNDFWRLSSDTLNYYLINLEVEGLTPGIYKLHPPSSKNSLELVLDQDGDFKQASFQMCLGQELASTCSFSIVYTVDFSKLIDLYGDRGYRYACMDAGQIGERINIICQHLKLGTSGIGGYFDDLINETLGLPLTQGILYISTVGVPDKDGLPF